MLLSLDVVTAAWRQTRLATPTLSVLLHKAVFPQEVLQRAANQRRQADFQANKSVATGYPRAEAAQSNGSGQHVYNLGVVQKVLLLAYAAL